MNHVDRQLGFLPLRQTVEVGPDNDVGKLGSDHGVEKLRLDLEMCRILVMVSIVRIVSLFSCRRTEGRS